ncbi:hypothetical protein [Arcobacter sp. CECT 8985]|uniref:hypothetical protein n=1 Tax=Arcobacter sp. CECT 8985 TaxID=1935424 RepID=UPI00100BD1DB|nr:hypothetical protein [Arcobacter sp. CECT 8985]RXJ86932.1 hypothetical protein CRU93_06005 [Arcobacter sp. CECT 8985]
MVKIEITDLKDGRATCDINGSLNLITAELALAIKQIADNCECHTDEIFELIDERIIEKEKL